MATDIKDKARLLLSFVQCELHESYQDVVYWLRAASEKQFSYKTPSEAAARAVRDLEVLKENVEAALADARDLLKENEDVREESD